MSDTTWRRLRMTLWVGLPFWAFVSVFNIFNTYLFIKIGQSEAGWDTPAERLLQHLLMLPFLLAAYFGALQLRSAVRGRWQAAGLQLALALAFACTYRPALLLGYGFGHHEPWPVMLHYLGLLLFSPWAEAVSEYVWCLLLYALGLLLLLNTVFYFELREERSRADDLQLKWLGAHLEALRSQLNPHFLFNSLNTISSLVLTKPERAHKLVVEFSDLLRRTLADGRSEYVSVHEELDYVRKYLSVEQTRFEDRLQAVIEADAAALDASLPAMILQPLVENALKHGIARTRGQGQLHISAARRDGWLSVSVSNTTSVAEAAADGHGIGLHNVRERLHAIYGERCAFSAGPDGPGRWVARLSVPPLPPALPRRSGSAP